MTAIGQAQNVAPYIASLCTSDCRSYNWKIGSVPEVILESPHGMSVCVDACIANVVTALWAAGFDTLSSCCGHGVCGPSIVLDSSVQNLGNVRGVIASVTERTFELLQWKLVAL